MNMQDVKAKHWCITINNYQEENLAREFEDPSISYSIRGKEVGDSGTPHIQGYVCFRNRQRLPFVIRLFVGCHAEIKRGTVDEAIQYCKKDNDYIEFGTPPVDPHVAGGAATAEKWTQVKDQAKRGDLESIDPGIFIRYYNTLKRIQSDYMVKPDDLLQTCGHWYYGPAGSGKTTKARQENPQAYIKSRDKWWDGYQGEEEVILDDLDKYNLALAGYIKDWGDKWTFKAEVKGGYIWIRPKKFIITSQYSIEQIWEDIETRDAVNRRYAKTHFGGPINSR